MDWTQEEREKFLAENCDKCANTGTYLCKMIILEEGKCMFYKEYENDDDYLYLEEYLELNESK